MEDEQAIAPSTESRRYPVWLSAIAVLFWLIGLGVCLLFGFFGIILLPGSSDAIGIWNLLVALAEAWVLFIAARHFFRGTQPVSTLFFWLALAVVGVPLVASGGCAMMADSLRIAG
jgi:hypothetical protein